MSRLSLETYLPYRLSVASNKVSALIARAYEAQFGLTVPQWRLLAVLSERPGQTQQALVAQTAMDKVTISRAAQALLERGLVARSPDPDDRRARKLALTRTGRRIVADVTPVALAFERALIDAIGDAEAERLEAALRQVEARAEALAGQEPG